VDIGVGEAALIDKLKEAFPDLEVSPMPIRSQAVKVLGAKGDILLQYRSSAYAEPIANNQGGFSQDRKPEWVCVLRSRDLSPKSGQTSAYALLDRIRVALSGFTIPGIPDVTRLVPVRDGFLDEVDGIWFYEMAFKHAVPEQVS